MKRTTLIKFNGITFDVEPFILYRGGNENDKLEAGWYFYPDETTDLRSFNGAEGDDLKHRIYVIPIDIHGYEDLNIISRWISEIPEVWESYCLYTHQIDQNIRPEDMIIHAASKGANINQLRTLSWKIQNTGIENISEMYVTGDKLVHIYSPNNHIFIHPDGSSHT